MRVTNFSGRTDPVSHAAHPDFSGFGATKCRTRELGGVRGQHRHRFPAAALLLATGACGWVGDPEPADDNGIGADAAFHPDDGPPDAAPGADAVAAPDAAPDTRSTVISADDIVDTYLRMTAPSFNYGASDRMCVDATDDRKVLLRIDVSTIPAGAQVVAASLHLWTGLAASDGSADTFSAYPMLESWDEGNANAAPATASYSERAAGTAWTAAGAGIGSRAGDAMGSFVPVAVDSELRIDLDPAVIQSWIEDEESNLGIAIVTASDDGACFDSTEFATAGKHPSLVVHWIP